MRQDVTFPSAGLNCAGWLYLPDSLEDGEKRPAIIMAHGFSAVKENYLANFAEKFEGAGFVVLVFDYRFFGDSEGEPRGHLIPAEQHKDYRDAITWISQRPEVEPERIGIWGSSYSGGTRPVPGVLRQEDQGRSFAGSVGQRLAESPEAHAPERLRRIPLGACPRPRPTLHRRGERQDTGGRSGRRTLSTADSRIPRVVHSRGKHRRP